MSEVSFPRQNAATRRFSLGLPRGFVIAPDGSRVVFLRSQGGTDPRTCLFTFDVAAAEERLLVDPRSLMGETEQPDLPAQERARRERQREMAEGIVRFSSDAALSAAVFDLAGRLFEVRLSEGSVRELPVLTGAVDARLDPTGSRVSYVTNGSLRVIELAHPGGDRSLASPENGDVTYGLAEFVAAEEMGRSAGYWWAPDGESLLVARVDVSRVRRRYISDPAQPESAPLQVAYPAAGEDNAEVSLEVITIAGDRKQVSWDREGFEYLVSADWSKHGLVVVVQSRDQRRVQVLEVDGTSGDSRCIRQDEDPDWVDIVDGVPSRLGDGTLVWSADRDGAKRLIIGDEAVTEPGLQLRSVLGVDGDTVLFRASDDPISISVFSWSPRRGVEPLGPRSGVATGAFGGGTTVVLNSGLDVGTRAVTVYRAGEEVGRIASLDEKPVIVPIVHLRRYGERVLRTAVLFPTGHEVGSSLLPVLVDPYAGPHAQRVTASLYTYLEPQWFADQGFAVVITDGRGTPGRGPAFDREVRGDLADKVLQDQIDALHEAAQEFSDLDLERVAIRGWSFGGYLAALAVLRRPDVFHAAVAGAPPTDWRLYDTHYTERYLGLPALEPGNYERTSLLREAARLERPLLLIHGLADDNVLAANTLLLSSALLAAGRPHSVLPLSGVTHMTPQAVVAENLLLFQVDFLRSALRSVL